MLRFADASDIDCSQPLRFTFDGRRCVGYAGDTLASALIGCAFLKTHYSPHLGRPRGVNGINGYDDTSYVQINKDGRSLIVSAAAIPLYDGLEAFSVQSPARFSLWNKVLGRKETFSTPWLHDDALLQQLQHSSSEAASASCEKLQMHTQVLVVGGGFSGAQIAMQLVHAGLKVLLCGRHDTIERRLFAGDVPECAAYAAQIRQLWREYIKQGHIQWLPNTNVIGMTSEKLCLAVANTHPLEKTAKVFCIHTQAIVLAHGATELMLPFANNDLPGIMRARALRLYAQKYGVSLGIHTLIACNNDTAYETAFTLRAMGGVVHGIIDSRRNPGAVMQAALSRGINVYHGSLVRAATGVERIDGVEIIPSEGPIEERLKQKRIIACDALGVSGGMLPYNDFMPTHSDMPIFKVGAAANCGADTDDILQNVQTVATQILQHFGHDYVAASPNHIPRSVIRTSHPDELAFQILAPDYTFVAPSLDILASAVPSHITTMRATEAPSYWYFTRTPRQNDYNDFEQKMQQRRIIDKIAAAVQAIAIGNQRLSALHMLHQDLKAYMLSDGVFLRPAYYRRGLQSKIGQSFILPDIQYECDALNDSAGVIDTSGDGILRFQGSDAAALLSVCIKLPAPEEGCSCHAVMSDDTGTLLAQVLAVRIARDHVLILVRHGTLTAVLKRAEYLQLAHRLMRVVIRDRREDEVRITLLGHKAIAIYNQLIDMPTSHVPPSLLRVENGNLPTDVVTTHDLQTVDFCVSVPRAETLWRNITAQGALPIGEHAREIWRIEQAQHGHQELRHTMTHNNHTLMVVHSTALPKKNRLTDAWNECVPEYISLETDPSITAQITSWCYAPKRGTFVGIAATSNADLFYKQTAFTQTSQHSTDGLPVLCFPMP